MTKVRDLMKKRYSRAGNKRTIAKFDKAYKTLGNTLNRLRRR